MKVEVGQEVLLRWMHGSNDTSKAQVTRIGRVYFYVKLGWQEIAFRLSDNLQKETGFGYGRDWKIYFSEQEIADEQESKVLLTAVKKYFADTPKKTTLEQLRQIAEILKIEPTVTQ